MIEQTQPLRPPGRPRQLTGTPPLGPPYYLEERFARALIRTTLSRLCCPGGTFCFSNIATPNPYAVLMTHIGRWNLVERTPPTSRPTSEPPRRREGTVAGPDMTVDATCLTPFDGAAR
ncbi:hypothetical protein [Streptomyces sp. NPDC001759]